MPFLLSGGCGFETDQQLSQMKAAITEYDEQAGLLLSNKEADGCQ